MTYITNPDKAHAFLKSVWPSEISRREKVLIVYLDRYFTTIGHDVLFVGGTDSCTMDTKIIFQYAIKEGAEAILLAHNHPGGILTPSRSDIEVTDLLVKGGQVLGVKVAHMIITRNDYQVLSFFE